MCCTIHGELAWDPPLMIDIAGLSTIVVPYMEPVWPLMATDKSSQNINTLIIGLLRSLTLFVETEFL